MPIVYDAVEQSLAGLHSRRAQTNTIKHYARDLRHFVQAVLADLGEITTSTAWSVLFMPFLCCHDCLHRVYS